MQNIKRILEIPKPLIMIAGLGDSCNKFETQLGLREAFQKKGYKVYSIGTKDYSPLFGIDTFPEFLFEPMRMTDKILAINQYVYKKVRQNNPDVVIVGVPGAIMQLTKSSLEDCGETAFVLGTALGADIGLLNIYSNVVNKEFAKSIANICKIRHSLNIDHVFISNYCLDYDNDSEEVTYFPIPSEHINKDNERYNGRSMILVNDSRGNQFKRICEKILVKLQKNI